MTKIILTTEEELEAIIKRILIDLMPPINPKNVTTGERDMDEIMTIKQVADFLSISIQTLYGKTSSRTIPHYKRGKRLYFKRNELLNWLSETKRKTSEELLKEWEQNQSLRKRVR